MTALIDTSVLVAAIVAEEAHHQACRALVAKGGCGMYAHGIAETFSTLTGGRRTYRLAASTVAELLEVHFVPRLTVATLTPTEILLALREAEMRGVRGGGIFDYLHLMAARTAKAVQFYTLNTSNFQACRRSGDPEIVHPGTEN